MEAFEWATAGDIPAMTRLWQQAFGDDPDTIALFFRDCFSPRRMLIMRRGAALAAMAAVFCVELVAANGNGAPCWYLYAVATERRFRGEGLATALLEQANIRARAAGARCAMVVPGEPGLRAFYADRGYRSWSHRAVHPVTALTKTPVAHLDAAAYGALREQLLRGVAHVRFGADFLQLQHDFLRANGGFLASWQCSGQRCCAVVDRCGGAAVVREVLPFTTALPQAVAGAAGMDATLYGPGDAAVFSMLHDAENAAPACGYLGLGLE
ncbi:MAG: GNAT family N-acetyltransferase [Oscillospiraceae bacterium]|nr:GNAT family N-acetyltransferase [Oscillospiraceae bacterium]